ncbi:MAG: plasmid replication protein, CyRepA1 family, partial [Cyanobacteria bacterium J06641_5]
MKAPQWTPFERVAAAEAIAQGLAILPDCWSLTPLRDKRPYREGWQSEPLVPRKTIADLLLNGERCRSKSSGKAYTGYISGYGLRLGEVSGGLVAIDIDGMSAEALLAAISRGVLPETVAWTSSKPGRRQMLYQVPAETRTQIQAFRRKALSSFGDLKAAEGELIEFRYNDHQSALPPSRHPDTGAYCWLKSPAEVAVAAAPPWLCELLEDFVRRDRERPEIQEQASANRLASWGIAGGGASELEKILHESLTRLSARDVYKWPGHQFRDYGKTWRGYCPQHRSQSGTTFAVDPESREWYCFCCEVGGGPVQYRHFANGGQGRPRGAEFVAIVRELAAESGLSVPAQVGNSAALELAPDAEATEAEVKQSIWSRSRQFSATHEIDRPYFDWEIPEPGTIVAVRSALGTGKTSWLGRAVQQLPDEGWLALGHRNSLLLQSCRRWGFAHLHIDNAFASIGAPESRLALCVDSLSHFQETDFTDKNIILDEAMAIVRHLLVGGTLKQQREKILEKFRQALRRAKRIFCLDGMLADWCVDYLQQLAGGDRPIAKVANQYRGEPLEVRFLTGSFDDRGKTKRNDRSPLLRQIWQSSRPVICTDSQIEAEALDRLLLESGKKGLRIDSKTSDRESVRDFLQSPNYFLRQQEPQYLIYTPAAEAGVDISLQGYFSDQFCLFFGVLHTNAQQQMIGRIRDAQVPRWIWCRSTGLQDGESQRWLLPQQLAGAFEDFLLKEGNNNLEGRSSTPEDRESMEQLVQRLLS